MLLKKENRNLGLLVLGQIISLFGSAIQRFALSLYLIDVTGSASIFASILAISMVPYIVIAPQVAMPHSSEKSEGVFGTAISFTKLKQPIRFESEGENEEKTASLFFTLAAKDPKEHLENIQKLSELLMTDGLVERLISTNSIDDYQVVMAEYN